MAGLLYKDFVSVSGKKIVTVLTCLTILFIVLRMVFPGTTEHALFLVENEEGEIVNILDVAFVVVVGCFLLAICSILNGWVGKLVEGDDRNKVRGYLRALPLEKNAYIASKYVFVGISAYVFLSVAISWTITANAFCREGIMSELLAMMNALIPSLLYIVLLSAAIELPLFLTIGKGRAMLIKTAIWLVLAFLVIGFLFFGDLVWIEQHLNIMVFLKWYQNHLFAVSLLNILFPVITLLLYYLSYCITCYFAGRETA